jgi:hypothetical protein
MRRVCASLGVLLTALVFMQLSIERVDADDTSDVPDTFHLDASGASTMNTARATNMGEVAGEADEAPIETTADNVSEEEPLSERFVIDNGFVILDGRFLSPPYVMECRGAEVLINGNSVVLEANTRRRGRRDETDPERDTKRICSVCLFARRLQNNALILGFDGRVAWIGAGKAIQVLDILLNELAESERLQRLCELEIRNLDNSRCTRIIQTFRPSDELIERFSACTEDLDEDPDSGAAPPLYSAFAAADRRDRAIQCATLIGMALVVLAAGLLLSHRPVNLPWKNRNESPQWDRFMLRCTMLIVLLSVFDLSCTLILNSVFGFHEVNPLARALTNSPWLLSVFKVTATGVGVGILWYLRKYVGAQVASWWLCLVLTMVTVRWLAVQSVFLA